MIFQRIAPALRVIALLVALVGTISRIIISLPGMGSLSIFFYFTVQSNLMVCAFLSAETIGKYRRKAGSVRVFHPAVQGGVLLYILVTAIVYNLLLAGGMNARGYDLLVLNINHGITPLLFLLDWLLSQRRGSYRWKHLGYWLVYPIGYAVFASIEGYISGNFRYFFLDFVNQGTEAYLIQIGAVTLFFVLLASLIIIYNRNLAPVEQI